MTLEQSARAAMEDPQFRAALDDLSIDVIECLNQFLDADQLAALARAGAQQHPTELVMAIILGWILGFHDHDEDAPDTERAARVGEKVKIAAYAAGMSHAMGNLARRRSVM
jgi:hypothetical protein